MRAFASRDDFFAMPLSLPVRRSGSERSPHSFIKPKAEIRPLTACCEAALRHNFAAPNPKLRENL
jgi:hypothetical protein